MSAKISQTSVDLMRELRDPEAVVAEERLARAYLYRLCRMFGVQDGRQTPRASSHSPFLSRSTSECSLLSTTRKRAAFEAGCVSSSVARCLDFLSVQNRANTLGIGGRRGSGFLQVLEGLPEVSDDDSVPEGIAKSLRSKLRDAKMIDDAVRARLKSETGYEAWWLHDVEAAPYGSYVANVLEITMAKAHVPM